MKFVVLEYAISGCFVFFSLSLTDRTQVTSSDSAGSSVQNVAPFSRWPACSPYRHRSPAYLDSLIDKGQQCRIFQQLAASLPLLVLLGSPILISFQQGTRHRFGPFPF